MMERHGFEWEQKGTHEQHLSVLDYKKQERSKELAEIETKLTKSRAEYSTLEKQIRNYEEAKVELWNFEKKLDSDPELQLPEPGAMMSARSYRTKIGIPVIDKLKKIIKELLARYSRLVNDLAKARQSNSILYNDNVALERENSQLREENDILRKQNKEYSLLRKVFGRGQIENWLRQAREVQQIKKERSRTHGWER